MRRRRLGVGVGGVVAAVLCAAVARGQEAPGGAGDATAGPEPSCELPRVTDRSRVSSFRCIACHDGTTGAGTVFEMRGAASGLGMSHPVEVDYGAAFARDPMRYVPEAHLPAEVPLVAGKVTCTSCHDGASPNAKHVANPMRLCYACHRM